MTEEEWRPIPGFENYEASNLGRVRSVTHKAPTSPGRYRTVNGRVRVATPGWKGYLDLVIRVDGVRKNRGVHQLVALAFLGPRPEGASMVCHRDGNNTNNVPGNLYWGTQLDNEQDKRRHGTHHYGKLEHCSRGHSLAGANLQLRNRVIRGRDYQGRVCIACSRARAACAKQGTLDQLQAVSDEVYASILAGAPKLCIRGHRLAISRNKKRPGCGACRSARQHCIKNEAMNDLQEVSDRFYDRLLLQNMAGAA